MTTIESSPEEKNVISELVHEILNPENQWLRDVLKRFAREGRLDAGSISCDTSLQRLLKLELVARLKDNEDDMDYQITNKGADILYVLNTKPEFRQGDWVTLCPTEFDSNDYDRVVRIQGFNENGPRVTYPEDYKYGKVESANVMDIQIELAELNHATYEECLQGQRR